MSRPETDVLGLLGLLCWLLGACTRLLAKVAKLCIYKTKKVKVPTAYLR